MPFYNLIENNGYFINTLKNICNLFQNCVMNYLDALFFGIFFQKRWSGYTKTYSMSITEGFRFAPGLSPGKSSAWSRLRGRRSQRRGTDAFFLFDTCKKAVVFFDMEFSEDLKTSKDIIQALLKAKKAIRMYPENNPIYRKTLDDTYTRFTEFFRYRNELNLRIKQNEILVDSDQVYHNPEKDDNLALFFFKDGLRELTFKNGLSLTEMEDFLKIITLDFDREVVDDDIVTLLWEKDFQNISYVADDTFLMEDEDYEVQATKEVKKQAAGTDEILKAYSEAFESEDVKDISIINLTDKDLQLLVKEMERDLQDRTVKIYTILFEMLFYAESPDEHEDVYRILTEVFLYCIKQGDLKTMVEILNKTKESVQNPSTPDTIKRQMNLLLLSVNSEESIKSMGRIFDSDTEVDEQVLNEFMGFLNRHAIPPLMTVLGELDSIHGRKIVIKMLIHLGRTDIQAVAKGLQDSRWYLVRNVIYILRHIGDKKAVEYILSTAKHADERVRKEGIKTLGELKSPLALQTLRDCIDDSDLAIRKLAVKALGNIHSETAKRLILERVSRKDFREKDLDEKRDFYEVLAQWNDKETAEFMVKTLKKRSFLKRAKGDENRACAAYGLGLMGNKDFLPLLDKFKDSKSKLLREYVHAAMRKIEHAG
jgi:hypothetical protein